KQMTRRERISAAIERAPVDRVPYAVWRHFPAVDRSPAGLAQATLRFHDHYGSDFLKITPRRGYCVEAWGCVEARQVLPTGSVLDEEAYARFGEPWDRRVLEALRPRSFLTVVHCHGHRLMFDRLARLPGHVWNWDDRTTGPALASGATRVGGAVCGGLDQWR